MMLLENWYFVSRGAFVNWYRAPEAEALPDTVPAIRGRVYGNVLFNDGEWVTTSRLMEVRINGDVQIAVTKNSEYKLHGPMNSDYKQWLAAGAKTSGSNAIPQQELP